MRNVAEEQIRWRLGEDHINFWFDTWLDAGPLLNPSVSSLNLGLLCSLLVLSM